MRKIHHVINHKFLRITLAAALSVSLLVSSGCSFLQRVAGDMQRLRDESSVTEESQESTDEAESKGKKAESNGSFKMYGDDEGPLLQQLDFSLFAGSATSDTLSLEFYLTDPEAFGLEISDPTLGEYTVEEDEEVYRGYEDCLAMMEDIDYDELSSGDKILYDVIEYDLHEALGYEGFYYYSTSLNSITGMQTQLPLILAEFAFDTTDDVETYLLLLDDYSRYFEDMMAYEVARAEAGFAPSDENIEKIIDSCESFLEDKDDHFLIDSFSERLETLDLSDSEIEAYEERNIEALESSVFPAYEMLAESFEELLGTGENEGGLLNFPDGDKYYALLMMSETSTDMTPEEAAEAIENSIDEQLEIIFSVDYDDEFDELYNSYSFSVGSTEENLEYCKDLIADAFPEIMDHDVTLKAVPSQLEDFFSPAAYLSCPIDDPTDNLILTNESQLDGYPNLLDTIAHEGYPGHLYEAVYHADNIDSYYQRSASFSGYSEGWAMYAGEFILQHTDLYDEELVDYIYAEDKIFNTLIPARIDIGVNYEGWSRDDAYEYIADLGLEYRDFSDYCYDMAIEIPCYYLSYCVGQIETNRILAEAFDAYGDDLSPAQIHEAYLAVGPAPLPIVEKYFNENLENAKNND